MSKEKTSDKKKSATKQLADEILAQNKPTAVDHPEVTPAERFSLKTERIERLERKNEESEIPKPVVLSHGLSSKDPFIVQKRENEIYKTLGGLFGMNDGDFFVHNQTSITLGPKTFRVVLVKDKNEFTYQIWFEVSNLSLLGNLHFQPHRHI